MELAGKVALVTGASRGIGKGIARALAHQGAFVVGTATTEMGAQQITEMLRTIKAEGVGQVLDVRAVERIPDFVTHLKKTIAAPDILINNAGITRDNIILRMKDEEWAEVLNVNLTGVFYLTRACVKDMIRAKWGRIINLSSIVAVIGNWGQANYAAAKAGLIGFSKSLAQEIASRQVTVNVVAPGYIETDMTKKIPEEYKTELLKKIPAQRIGSAEDVANAVSFLASPRADYITGQTLHVNGGMYM